jgi:Family of unknown function (DUF6491)
MTSRLRWIGLGAALLAAALLGACSAPARRDAPKAPEAYLQYAGAPIQRFSYRDSDYRWQSASADRLVVLVANDAYVLRVSAPCAQLQFALDIRLSTATRGTVSRYDYVRFDDQKCLIDEIRQVDYRRMQQDAAQKSG